MLNAHLSDKHGKSQLSPAARSASELVSSARRLLGRYLNPLRSGERFDPAAERLDSAWREYNRRGRGAVPLHRQSWRIAEAEQRLTRVLARELTGERRLECLERMLDALHMHMSPESIWRSFDRALCSIGQEGRRCVIAGLVSLMKRPSHTAAAATALLAPALERRIMPLFRIAATERNDRVLASMLQIRQTLQPLPAIALALLERQQTLVPQTRSIVLGKVCSAAADDRSFHCELRAAFLADNPLRVTPCAVDALMRHLRDSPQCAHFNRQEAVLRAGRAMVEDRRPLPAHRAEALSALLAYAGPSGVTELAAAAAKTPEGVTAWAGQIGEAACRIGAPALRELSARFREAPLQNSYILAVLVPAAELVRAGQPLYRVENDGMITVFTAEVGRWADIAAVLRDERLLAGAKSLQRKPSQPGEDPADPQKELSSAYAKRFLEALNAASTEGERAGG